MITITFKESGAKTVLPAGSSLSLVDEMEESEIPFSCKSGCCGSCVVRLSCDEKQVNAKDENELSFLESMGFFGNEYRLACQCVLTGDAIIDTNC